MAAIIVEKAIADFEKSPTLATRDSAVAALVSLQSLDKDATALPGFKMQAVTLLMQRTRTLISDGSLNEAVADYEQAVALGAVDAVVNEPLKAQLVVALTTRCRDSLSKQALMNATWDYLVVARWDITNAKSLAPEFAKLPVNIIATLPIELIEHLPIDDISRLPVEVIANLSTEVIAKLPKTVFAKLPPKENSIGMKLKIISSGTFIMGSPKNETEIYNEEDSRHLVKITKPFYIEISEVTQAQYARVMDAYPSHFKGSDRPVEKVSFIEAVEFCRRLSNRQEEKSSRNVYRLPSEAEWEYACRAGTDTAFCFNYDRPVFDIPKNLDVSGVLLLNNTRYSLKIGGYAWYGRNSESSSHPVCEKTPNTWGLYDMHGNVAEWCSETYSESESGLVARGGTWNTDDQRKCRSASRWTADIPNRSNMVGFRIVLE